MRHQKTEPQARGDDLPPLNAQEAIFVERLGQGDTKIDAYKKAYGGEGYAPASLRVAACQKSGEAKIQQWLRHLQAAGFERACQSLQQRIEDEMAFGARCELAGNYGAAGMTRDRCNKLMGLYIERAEIVVTSSPEQTLKELEEMLGGEPIEVRH